MHNIQEFMADDHRACDVFFARTEQAVSDQAWASAEQYFTQFQTALLQHFSAEETFLFPAFEAQTGMRMGPTQVMRGEHLQMRQLMDAARAALLAQDADDYAGYADTLLIMLQQHNLKEENVLYPLCDQHLASQLGGLLPQLQQTIQAKAA